MSKHILICRNLENFVTSIEGVFNHKPEYGELVGVVTKRYMASDFLAGRFEPEDFGALIDSVPEAMSEMLSDDVGFTHTGWGFNFDEWVMREIETEGQKLLMFNAYGASTPIGLFTTNGQLLTLLIASIDSMPRDKYGDLNARVVWEDLVDKGYTVPRPNVWESFSVLEFENDPSGALMERGEFQRWLKVRDL